MHSKWQIWDFFKNVQSGYLTQFEGILILNTFDSVCLRMVKDYLFKHLDQMSVLHKTSQEVTREWIETEFQTLSLFQKLDNFFIHHANELSSEIIEILPNLDISDRFVILSFENMGVCWKKVIQEKKYKVIEIEPPKFWEFNKVLDFLMIYFKLNLSFELKNWILESFDQTFGSFYHLCSVLKINYPEGIIGIEEAKLVLSPDKFDQFHLASLFSRKKTSEFYSQLNCLEQDYDKFRELFRFLQSHLIKLSDITFLKKKPKITPYDKELQKASPLWSTEELKIAIKKFNDFEILTKRKDPQIWIDLKSHQLSSELNLK